MSSYKLSAPCLTTSRAYLQTTIKSQFEPLDFSKLWWVTKNQIQIKLNVFKTLTLKNYNAFPISIRIKLNRSKI